MSPLKDLYGREPPIIPLYSLRSSTVEAIDDLLRERDELLRTLKKNLFDSQNRMKEMAYRKTREV